MTAPTPAAAGSLKRPLVILLRLGVSATILVYLVTHVYRDDPETFGRLLREPKNWQMLLVGWMCCTLGLLVGFARWYVLTRGLGFALRLRDVLRIAMAGFTIDFGGLGAVGGDLFKAVMLGRVQSGRRVEAAASVIADRAIGLLMLLSVATVTLSWTAAQPSAALALVHRGIVLAAAAAWTGVAFAFAFVSFHWEARIDLSRFGTLGELFQRVIDAARMYRRRPTVLLAAAALALITLALNVTGIYLLSAGFPAAHPTWLEHWRIVPPALLTGIVPLPADTLGALDYATSSMYYAVTNGRVAESLGLLVMMTSRVVSLAVAIVGLTLYLGSGMGILYRFAPEPADKRDLSLDTAAEETRSIRHERKKL